VRCSLAGRGWLFWLPAILVLLAGPVAGQVRVDVDVSVKGKPISRNLFGKFTEHLGRNVYQGAWAQIVENPAFVPSDRWPNRQALERNLTSASQIFSQATLLEDSKRGFAPYWAASGDIRGELAKTGIRDSQKLTVGPRGGTLETGVFPPLHRVGRLELTVKGRAGARTTAKVRLLTAGRRKIGETWIALSPEWSERKYEFEVERVTHRPGDPYLLSLQFEESGEVELARLLLFPSDHVEGWEPEVVRYLKEARLPLLRFPGGNFVSAYHWEDGIGPLDERPVLPNPAWPVVEWNHVGVDEWLRLCELVGAEALICVNAGNGTPEEAARWVKYCNDPPTTAMGQLRARNGHPRPYGVRLWEVGNELSGKHQEGFTDARGYAARYRRFEEALHAADPQILLIANGFLGRPADMRKAGSPTWNEALVQENGSRVRSISLHTLYGGRIPQDADPVEVWREWVADADELGDQIEELIAKPMRQAGLKPLTAITEMQIMSQGPKIPTNKTIAEALYYAAMLNGSIRSDGLVELVTHSALLNHGGGLGKQRGVVFTDPVWWTTHLYGSQEGTIPVAVSINSPTFSSEGKYLARRENVRYVDAVALLSPDGRTCNLLVANRHPASEYEVTITLKGFDAGEHAEAVILKADNLLARNTWDSPRNIWPEEGSAAVRSGMVTRKLPPLSLTRLVLRSR
jgi:alpha-N-arabinofuranosidase